MAADDCYVTVMSCLGIGPGAGFSIRCIAQHVRANLADDPGIVTLIMRLAQAAAEDRRCGSVDDLSRGWKAKQIGMCKLLYAVLHSTRNAHYRRVSIWQHSVNQQRSGKNNMVGYSHQAMVFLTWMKSGRPWH
jgi:hypothetical protein